MVKDTAGCRALNRNYIVGVIDMAEKIIRIVEEKESHGLKFQIVETQYEFGTHFVLKINGEPGFHATDLERVEKYMNSFIR